MASMGTATLEIAADTTRFKEQIAEIKDLLADIPTAVINRWEFRPWALVRAGWYIGIGLTCWCGVVYLVARLLGIIFGENILSTVIARWSEAITRLLDVFS